MKTSTPNSPNINLANKKSSAHRGERLNVATKTGTNSSVNNYVNRSSELTTIRNLSKTSYSPNKQRRDTLSVEPTKSARTITQNTQKQEKPKGMRESMSKAGKTWSDVKNSVSLTKAEAAKFSPYVTAKKEEELRDKLLHKIIVKQNKKAQSSMSDILSIKPAVATKEAKVFTFVLGKGNNDKAVRNVLLKRHWWKETSASNPNADFSWFQTNKPINFAQLTGKTKKSCNHFEFNREIGTKNSLLKNLQSYCEKAGQDLFRITPMTFTLDLYSPHYSADYQIFLKHFKEFTNKTSEEPKNEEIKISTETELSKPMSKSTLATPRVAASKVLNTSKLCDSYYNGCNLWLLKPTDFNRGRGINLFNKISTLEGYLKSFQTGEDVNAKNGSSSPLKGSSSSMNLVKSSKFVVQKYIEKPLLIDMRKFDIRWWVLVDQEMNVYMFKEAYLRLSSEAFSLNNEHVEDKYVHLTNNAVQKYGQNYGKHESGNIVSFTELEKHLTSENPAATMVRIKERMKELIKISMNSVRFKINASERKNCFEVFGYDFILDDEHNVFIIEVNSNPSIDESNALLSTIVPRMLDDMFRLTLDKMYVQTPAKLNTKTEEKSREEVPLDYPVPGYSNDENLWEYLTNISNKRL